MNNNGEEPKAVELTIVYVPLTDQIHLSGPLANKGLCYGMLEKAKDVIREYVPGKSPGIIIPEPNPEILT